MAFVPVGMVRLQLLQIGVCSALVSVPMTHLPLKLDDVRKGCLYLLCCKSGGHLTGKPKRKDLQNWLTIVKHGKGASDIEI